MKKLLIVEDNADILEVVQIILMNEGYEVKSTSNSDEACLIVQEFNPDLIIIDFLIPGKDGGALCSQLKKSTATSHIPIIIFSAHPQASQIVEEVGANGFISKPFNVKEFVSTIKTHTE